MSTNSKAIVVFVSMVILLSTLIMFGYHIIYVRPVNKGIINALVSEKEAWENSVILDRQLKNYIDNKIFFQSLINKTSKLIFEIQTVQIENLEQENKMLNNRVENLERRHLETLRAICQLQKKHWKGD